MSRISSLNRASTPPSLNKKSSTSTDSNPSDDQLRSMEAPLHVDTPLWNISTVGERCELLNGYTAKEEQSTSAESMEPTTRQVAIIGEEHRWPDGVVPYILDPSLSPAERQEVMDGIQMVEDQTNVTFVRLPDNDGDGVPDGAAPLNFISFRETPLNPDGTFGGSRSEFIGMAPEGHGQQFITTSTSPNHGVGTVAHEIMHGLGFHHEQYHPDVNNPGNPVNVTGVPIPRPDTFPVSAYDPGSIMHYPTGNNLVDGSTITPQQPGTIPAVGQRINLSQGDIDAINQLYPSKDPNDIAKVIPLGDGYTLELENQDNAWKIKDAEGNIVRIWGDPHVDENADGSDDWDFVGTTTFVLGNGTKITVGTKDVGDGKSVTDTLTITEGDRVLVVTGIADDNVQIDSSEDGINIDQATHDGDVYIQSQNGVNQWDR